MAQQQKLLAVACAVLLACVLPTLSQITCDPANFYANINYTNPFVDEALNTLGNYRPEIAGSPWISNANFLYYFHYDGAYQMYFVFNETSVRGGNGSTGPLFNYIITGDLVAGYYSFQIFIHDTNGNCLLNGMHYTPPVWDWDIQDDSNCAYIDTYGDMSANTLECYVRSNGPWSNKKFQNETLGNIPHPMVQQDLKYSLNDLPNCLPLHRAFYWANTTLQKTRTIEEFYLDVQFNDDYNYPITVYSTCSNFPGPHPFTGAMNPGGMKKGTASTSRPSTPAVPPRKYPFPEKNHRGLFHHKFAKNWKRAHVKSAGASSVF